MEVRRLGRTGHHATITMLGGCGLGRIGQEEADKAVELAMEHGVNTIDVAPTYGEAEVRLRPWVERYRDHFFLAGKTQKRTKAEAWEQLNRSLMRLETDHFDLYQFHAVGSMAELKQILGEDGAIEALKEARETGLIKYIGVTGHADVRVHMRALELFDFDTVLTPVNVASMVNPDPVNDFRPLIKMARDRDVGVIAIKAIQRRRWTGERRYRTWYEPLESPREIDMALWFTLSQEGVTTYSLPCDVGLWLPVLSAAERYRKLNEQEQEDIIRYARKHEFKPLFPK